PPRIAAVDVHRAASDAPKPNPTVNLSPLESALTEKGRGGPRYVNCQCFLPGCLAVFTLFGLVAARMSAHPDHQPVLPAGYLAHCGPLGERLSAASAAAPAVRPPLPFPASTSVVEPTRAPARSSCWLP